MDKLNREDLLSLESYHEQRTEFRRTVMAHKVNRQISIGEHVTLYFEDRLTVQYQVQEMLRVERVFEAKAIEEELLAYNPLIPDGSNWKATMMIEYEDAGARAVALEQLVGIEDRVWAKIGTCDPVWAIADEDLERSRSNKTSAVHFLRFEFNDEMLSEAAAGADISLGIDHRQYDESVKPLGQSSRNTLVADFV